MRKDYKIICFVRNEIDNNTILGLFSLFGSNFYQKKSFVDEYIYTDEPNLHVKFGTNVDNKFLLISKDKIPMRQSSIKKVDVWDILLVSQDIRFSNFTDEFFTKDMLVMYHGNNDDNKKDVEENIKEKVRKIKPGHHIPNDEQYGYSFLTNISDAWDSTMQKFDSTKYTQAKEKLIKWFGLNEKLNKALEFLHQSLGGTADKSILTNEGDAFELTKDKYKNKTLDAWINELNGKTGDAYNKALADVRDALLEQAGVTGENNVVC